MFLSSITLILQEILEGALIISALLAVTQSLSGMRYWIALGVLLGSLTADAFGSNIVTISEWFNYVGQEVSYAVIQLSISLLLALIVFLLNHKGVVGITKQWLSLSCVLVVTLAVTREGSEIIVYLQGVMAHPDQASSALAGSSIGAGIGVSVGVLFYYLLSSLAQVQLKWVGTLLLALIGGNMCAQAMLLFTQADWIGPTRELWDSSSYLSEYSLMGRLLYALIGYEATPSLAQVGGYLTALLFTLACGFIPVKRHQSTPL